MTVRNKPYLRVLTILCCVALLSTSGRSIASSSLSRLDVADALTEHALSSRFPRKLEFEDGRSIGLVEYTFDVSAHSLLADLYRHYQPDYACFVAIDVSSGAIITSSSFIKANENWDNLAFRSEYPAASIFKIISAAAGIETGVVNLDTVIPFNGKSTSLYKKQVLRAKSEIVPILIGFDEATRGNDCTTRNINGHKTRIIGLIMTIQISQ